MFEASCKPIQTIEGYYSVGKVSLDLTAQVLAVTNLDVTGFEIVLDRSGILHTLKQPGLLNTASELAQGQIPMEAVDFEEVPERPPPAGSHYDVQKRPTA